MRARSIHDRLSYVNDFNYFQYESILWLLLAMGCLMFSKPLAVVLHEIGHLLPAFTLTSGPIKVVIGESTSGKFIELGNRIKLFFSLDFSGQGSTEHNDCSLSAFYQCLILIGGPLFSILVTSITGIILLKYSLPVWSEICLAGFFCANLLVFLRSAIPMKLKPTKRFPEPPPSDGLQILQILRNRT